MLASDTHDRLARSLFAFALLAWLVATAACAQLLLAPPSPDALFAQLRLVVLAGAGVLWLLCGAAMVWAWRAPAARLNALAARLAAALDGLPRVTLLLGSAFVANVALRSALRDVAPPVAQPLLFWLAGWSLVGAFVALTAAWQPLQAWLNATRAVWMTLGLGVSLLAVLLVSAWAVNGLVAASGVNDALRGGLDYRSLDFLPEGDVPSAAAFWQEQAKTRVRWLPYSYWTVTPLDGQFIHVDARGVRATPLNVPDDAPTLAFFGGSTVWGEGARDGYTLPALVGKRLAAAGTPYRVVNYGQTGYVLTQDMLLFQMRLLNGDVPQLAVFYGGFNDLLAGYSQDIAGVTLQEFQRMNDAEAGRALRSGQPVLAPYALPLARESIALVTPDDGAPAHVMARYVALVEMIERLAAAYGVRVLFVWQPSIVFKQPLAPSEAAIYARMRQERAGFAERYQEADALLRAYVATRPDAPILLLNDLFVGDERAIFYDLIHVTEVGNAAIADALLPTLSRFVAAR